MGILTAGRDFVSLLGIGLLSHSTGCAWYSVLPDKAILANESHSDSIGLNREPRRRIATHALSKRLSYKSV